MSFPNHEELTRHLFHRLSLPINYAEADKVKSVDTFLGFKMVVHEDIPPNEVHIVQHGRCVAKMTFKEMFP